MRARMQLNVGAMDDLCEARLPTTRKSIAAIADSSSLQQNEILLEKLAGTIQTSPINGFASLVNYAPTADRPIHRWFWYREGYSVELVNEFIKTLPRGALVLDPFCGAGTSLLAAQQLGYPSIGIDVNPISTLVSRVKTTNLSTADIDQIQQEVLALELLDASASSDPKPGLKIIDKVFEARVLQALLIFRRQIKAVTNPRIRDFLFVAWLSIVEGVSNVFKEGNGIKYRNRKRTDGGYINLDLKDWENAILPTDRFEFVRTKLLHQIRMMLADVDQMPRNPAHAEVITAPAERLASHLAANSISLTIFSPPYCNCFNYFKAYKIELWMGEFVRSYADLKVLNRTGLRSHVETVLKRSDDQIEPESEQYAALLDGLALWDKRIPRAVRGYFIDMARVLAETYTVLKPSGKCVLVVGNSAYGGIVIPTDLLLARIAERLGYRVEKVAVARSLTTSSQQRSSLGDRLKFLRESIVVLEKPDPRLVDHKLVPTDEIPNDDNERAGKVFVIRNAGLTAYTHKFHRYPGKFIPHIPRWAMGRFITKPKSQLLLDPFCGSGTTLVEASLRGVRSYGIDIDPIARLVSRVKSTPIDSGTIDRTVTRVLRSISRRTRGGFAPKVETLSHWFNQAAIHDLGLIRNVIDEYEGERQIYEFLLVCYAAIIRRASNADNQTQKTYVSHTHPKVPEPAKQLFQATLLDYAERLKEFSAQCRTRRAKVLDVVDARTFGSDWAKARLPLVDLVLTSPPYLNSVDYVYNQMAEYFWLGDLFGLDTQPEQNQHKRAYIGTTKIDAAEYRQLPTTGEGSIDELAAQIAQQDQKSAYIVAKYFIDMAAHFRQAAQVLKPNGTYVCVVGDSLLAGTPVPVHAMLGDVAKRAGFEMLGMFGYEIRNRHMRFPRMGRGGMVRYDWVLELRKDN